MQNCMSETARILTTVLAFFVLVFCFEFATFEIKHWFISVLFQLCGHHNSSMNMRYKLLSTAG